jgi:hypothetical protein
MLSNSDEQLDTVTSVWKEAAGTFDAVRDLVERIVSTPGPASS